MLVRGVEINSNMDIEEVLILFNSLVVASESVNSELEENFRNYQGISESSVANLEKYKEILQTITAIQVKTQRAFEQASNLDEALLKKVAYLQDRIQEENKQTYLNIKKSLLELEPFTQNAINKAVENVFVDTSKIEASIEKKLEAFDVSDINNTISYIEERSQALHSINKTFYANIEHLSQANENLQTHTQDLEATVTSVNDAVSSFRGINRSVSMAMSAALLFVGLVFGFGVATLFKIEAVSGYYFSTYDEKQQKLEDNQLFLEKRISELEGLPAFLAKHGITVRYDIFNKEDRTSSGVPFIALKLDQMYAKKSQYTFERKEEKFIGFKKP